MTYAMETEKIGLLVDRFEAQLSRVGDNTAKDESALNWAIRSLTLEFMEPATLADQVRYLLLSRAADSTQCSWHAEWAGTYAKLALIIAEVMEEGTGGKDAGI